MAIEMVKKTVSLTPKSIDILYTYGMLCCGSKNLSNTIRILSVECEAKMKQLKINKYKGN